VELSTDSQLPLHMASFVQVEVPCQRRIGLRDLAHRTPGFEHDPPDHLFHQSAQVVRRLRQWIEHVPGHQVVPEVSPAFLIHISRIRVVDEPYDALSLTVSFCCHFSVREHAQKQVEHQPR